MATIINAQNLTDDLVGGKIESSPVVNPVFARIQTEISGATSETMVVFQTYKVNDGSAYADLLDSKGAIVSHKIVGNKIVSIYLDDIKTALLKVVLTPLGVHDGDVSTIVIEAEVKNNIQIVDDSGNVINPSGTPANDSVEITRPANTTAYTALDAIGNNAAAVAQVETITLTGASGSASVTGAGGVVAAVAYTEGTAQVEIVTLTGASGTATIAAAGGLSKLVTFAAGGTQDKTQTAADFVTSWALDYAAVGIVVTSNLETIIFTANNPGTAFTAPTITNATGDLAGTVNHSVANVTDLAATAAVFFAAYETDYGSEGITLTNSGNTIIMTAAVAGVPFTAPVITNVTGDLAGTVAHSPANVTLTSLELQSMAIASGGGGFLMDVKVESDIVAIASTTLRIWFFNEAPATVQGDNVAYALVYADKDKRMFYVDIEMDARVGASASILGQAAVMKQYKCADTSLFIQVETVEGFTPTSGGKINITANVLKLN